MGKAIDQIRRRRQARVQLTDVFASADKCVVIHYSYEALIKTDGTSSRITSIAVQNLERRQIVAFSIHLLADREKLTLSGLSPHYDRLEKQMLKEFYEYVNKRHDYFWLHWNMRDTNYGFHALEHRFRRLGGKPVEIDEARMINLEDLLEDIYGNDYIEHRRMEKLMRKNSISEDGFLTREEEAAAFQSEHYGLLHQSTLRKVLVIASIARRAQDHTLKTNKRKLASYGTYSEAFLEIVTEGWFGRLLSFLAGILIPLILWSVGLLDWVQEMLRQIQ